MLTAIVISFGMTALVEVHTEEEADRALEAGASVIGVNARNLKTLDIDQATFGRLAPLVPDDRVKVAESGIFGRDDVARVVVTGETVRVDGGLLATGGM